MFTFSKKNKPSKFKNRICSKKPILETYSEILIPEVILSTLFQNPEKLQIPLLESKKNVKLLSSTKNYK